MTDTTTPIYDSMISAFYFFTEPNQNKDLEDRISELSRFYEFLTDEYNRILELDLLAPSIRKFRLNFSPQSFTDQKIIDSLIWAFVSMQKNKGLSSKNIVYR